MQTTCPQFSTDLEIQDQMAVEYLPTKSQTSAHIDLLMDGDSASIARHFARQILTDWGHTTIIDEVSLAVSELITNAIIHAHSNVGLTIVKVSDGIQLRVTDASPRQPNLRPATSQSTHGRGMRIIDHIARSWGVEVDSRGKTVWVEIGL